MKSTPYLGCSDQYRQVTSWLETSIRAQLPLGNPRGIYVLAGSTGVGKTKAIRDAISNLGLRPITAESLPSFEDFYPDPSRAIDHCLQSLREEPARRLLLPDEFSYADEYKSGLIAILRALLQNSITHSFVCIVDLVMIHTGTGIRAEQNDLRRETVSAMLSQVPEVEWRMLDTDPNKLNELIEGYRQSGSRPRALLSALGYDFRTLEPL